MAQIDPKDLAAQMAKAAADVLKREWAKARTYAEPAFERLAATAVEIEASKLAGKITEDDARIMMKMHKNSFDTVVLTLKDEGVIAAEQAINAALGVAAGIVNTALGWHLLG
jgi:hypothetical protein